MKPNFKYGLLLMSILFFNQINGQITITHVSKIDENDNLPLNDHHYDSTINFLGRDVFNYVGQQLLLKGMTKGLREFGYINFFTTNGCGLYGEDNYILNHYKSLEGKFTSNYDDLVGKYFEVVEILPNPEIKYYRGTKEALKDIKILTGKEDASSKKLAVTVNKKLKLIDSNFFYDGNCFFKMLEKESGDTVYYEYSTKSKDFFDFPFIIVGYFDKLKNTSIGREYVISDDWINTSNEYFTGSALDNSKLSLVLEKGSSIINVTGQVWKCIDVIIDDDRYDIGIIIQDSSGHKRKIDSYHKWQGEFVAGKVYSLKDASDFKIKFGENTFDSLLHGNVIKGMTKEMCMLSLGKPEKKEVIKKSGKETEHWYYYYTLLSFENGLLTSIDKPNWEAIKKSKPKKK